MAFSVALMLPVFMVVFNASDLLVSVSIASSSSLAIAFVLLESTPIPATTSEIWRPIFFQAITGLCLCQTVLGNKIKGLAGFSAQKSQKAKGPRCSKFSKQEMKLATLFNQEEISQKPMP